MIHDAISCMRFADKIKIDQIIKHPILNSCSKQKQMLSEIMQIYLYSKDSKMWNWVCINHG